MRILEINKLNDEDLKRELLKNGISLTVEEAKRVVKILKRNPTLVELHLFNSEWSEHCSYKSSKSTLEEFLPTAGPNVIQGPEEDAGIIELVTINGQRYGLVIAHESHNHPSQVLPVEGAATGIGGVVRDVDCMGARVVAVADPLRFGDPLGKNGARTKWIANGVVTGIWEYANALGVPNMGGDTCFNSSFDDNCLVNVVALGVIKETDIVHSAVPKEAASQSYDLILVGKPTDNSGFGGATFASKLLDEEQEEESKGAVQVPDPFLKNVLLMRKANEEVLTMARENGYSIGFKDLGAAGIVCASSELCASGGFGADINLDDVPVAMNNLLPEVIGCAETQERYILAVPSLFTKEVLKIYNQNWDLPDIYEGACAQIIGQAKVEKRYILRHKKEVVCDCPIDEVVKGIRYKRVAKPLIWKEKEPEFEQPTDLKEVLLKVLASPNVASKECIYRFYDTEVQGNTVIRPGEADASLIAPLEEIGSKVGVALSCDGNPFYGRIDPYWGGATAVAEAMRNVAAVGAVPSGLTDCLNYGNPEKEEVFYQFREGVRGIADAAKNIWLKGHPRAPVPVVSGNVSFYNESSAGKSIDPSPIIACVGIIDDYSKAITLQLKRPESLIFLVGERKDELGGSEYYQQFLGVLGRNVPQIDFEFERRAIYAVLDTISSSLVLSCHDISNGGLVVTLVEMILGGRAGGRLGATVDLSEVSSDLRNDKKLFSESSGFILEVDPSLRSKFEEIFNNYQIKPYLLGKVIKQPFLVIKDRDKELIRVDVKDLAKVWLSGTKEVMR